MAQNVLYGAAQFIAETLSKIFFEQPTMYEAVLNDAEIYVNWKMSEIKTKYPNVVKATIEQFDAEKIASMQNYLISFENEDIKLIFKIYDEERSNHIPDKAAIVVINAEQLLQSLGFTDIDLCADGQFSIGGIKCKPKRGFLSLQELILSGTVTVFFVSLYQLMNVFRKMKEERFYSDRLLRKALFQEAMLEFTRLILKGKTHDASQYILEKAVKLVPGAQAGSLLMKKGDLFVFTNLCGYDKKILETMFFRPTELAQGLDGRVKIIKDLNKLNEAHLDEERKRLLYSEGHVGQIKVLLSIPVVVRDEIVAFFNLDNFEDENAFTQESIEMAELFAAQVGLLFERTRLVEELAEQKRMMEYYSYHDPLTGLANRRLLEEFADKILALAKRTGRSACVLYMDFHRFKQVNDTYGHLVGDEILKRIALRLEKAIRENDIVARFGGDEFVFLLYDLSVEEITTFTKRLLEIVQEPLVVDGNEFSISANFGIALYPTDGDNLETLLRHSDMAMYVAKNKKQPFAFYLKPLQHQEI
ncbi:MAG: diguanylate cyclase domain-containing protein [Pseudothermotoga sp.]